MSLRDVRILDLTRLLPGAHCTMLLARMGAEVIKVEDPAGGDYMRWMPPLEEGQSVLFHALNAGKQSITLNLKAAAGRETFLQLVRGVDVVVEGNRPGVMQRLGLGWDALRDARPALVMCSITGYGQTGPYAGRAGHDLNYMAVAGALALNGAAGGPPLPLGVQVADIGGGGLAAAVAILGALVDVARGGTGCHLDISMTDEVIDWIRMPLALHAAEGELPERGRQRLTGRYPCYRVYACAGGGYYSVGALEPKFWVNLCTALERPDLVAEQFAEGEAGRRTHAEMETIFATRSRDGWTQVLDGLEVCCEPVLELDEVAAHPQLRHRGVLPQLRGRAPALGADTDAVLSEAGITAGRIGELRSAGVI